MPKLHRPLSLLWSCALCLPAVGGVFPGRTWEEALPEAEGLDPARLARAVSYLEKHSGRNGVKRLVLVRNGRIVWRGPEVDVRQMVWSVTKAFTSTAQGLLIQEGKCTLDTRAAKYNPRDLARWYSGVTLRHFATMTSGYDGEGGAYDFDEKHRGDQNAFVRPLPPFFEPGAKFQYWDEATQQYGYVLTRIAGVSLYDYLKERILDPIGITRFAWRKDSTGKVLNWTGGIEISATDLARFGLLYLNRGKWKGKQLLSAEWVDGAASVQVPPWIPDALPRSSRKGSGVYGFHWWVNGRRPDGTRPWPHAPVETYCRSGYNNNRLFVIPPWRMVVVRLGLDQSDFHMDDTVWDEFLKLLGQAIMDWTCEGERLPFHPLVLTFRGPHSHQKAQDPNPFLDFRLQVTFTSPGGRKYVVPGFFDGDGFGGPRGNIWRVRFAADGPGRWNFRASFRRGPAVAVSLDPKAAESAAFDGTEGSFRIEEPPQGPTPRPFGGLSPFDPTAPLRPGYLSWGFLKYAGCHYLKFAKGPYWIRGGTDSPENFLAYQGFVNTPPSHSYSSHIEDWKPGDPDWGRGKGRGIIGALNYLSSRHVNSLYMLLMNVGGDGKDVWPWAGPIDPNGNPSNDNLHFDLAKLKQWEIVFDHAQRRDIFLHFVLNEAEVPNKRELDDGELGMERKLYYRELVARFSHHVALEWNLCEEYNLGFNFGPERIRRFASYLKALDPYDHPIAVHSAGDPLKQLRFTFGDPLFGMTSIQLNQRRIDTLTEAFRLATERAGRPLPVSMDEFTVDCGQPQSHVPVDVPDLHRKQKLWPTYLSGGMIEFILEGFLKVDSFKKPKLAELWDYIWYARKFLQKLPFWRMQPADELLTGEGTIEVGMHGGKTFRLGGQVFALPGRIYAVYLPCASPAGKLDLRGAPGVFRLRYYNPRRGIFEGEAREVSGRKMVSLGPPPADPAEDWAVLLDRRD